MSKLGEANTLLLCLDIFVFYRFLENRDATPISTDEMNNTNASNRKVFTYSILAVATIHTVA